MKRPESIQTPSFSDEILNLDDDLLFILDYEGNFLKINELGALSIDYKPEELKGKHIFSIFNDSYYESAVKHFSTLLSGNYLVKFDAVVKTRLNSHLNYNFTLHVLRNEDGQRIGGIGKNISAVKRNEEKIREMESKLIEAQRLISIERARWKQDKSVLEELNRLKSEFISNISHELRTPLASIIGFSETILSDPDMSSEMREEFNNIILTEGKRLARLINEILEISRMESGRVALMKSNLELGALLKESVENNIEYLKKKNLKFTFELPDDDVIITGDREKLLNVFEGIINNSVKFTPDGGRLKVILHKMSKEAEVIISDTGIGIPEKDLPQIFQKFFSIKTESDIPQVGLGLVFAKQIIDLHKGLIVVHSEVNKGTTFVVKLPYQNKVEGGL